MRLGTQTGSLINHAMTHGVTQPAPAVDTPATLCGWTDRHPGTVIEVDAKPGKPVIITIQEDKATAPAGHSNAFTEAQRWEYSRDPNGWTTSFRQRKDGGWEEVQKGVTGRWSKVQGGKGLVLGRREKYRDPSF